MIHPFDPYSYVRLQGTGLTRGVTMVLSTAEVRELLPQGLELGEQDLTPPGTHPVILLFHDMFRVHMSIPTPLPNMTYREHSIGVPFAYVAHDFVGSLNPGPYYFMPKLHLDDFWAVLGGRLYWGLAKHLARFSVDGSNYEVMERDGEPITSLHTTDAPGAYAPVVGHAGFAPIRAALDQPIISMAPLGMGPFFVLSHFDKDWGRAQVRSIATCMHIDRAYVPGLPTGAYPWDEAPFGLAAGPLGSYEYRAPWRMTLPYLARPGWW